MSKKILISRGYGAGWSSWMHEVPTTFACEYRPIIDAIEKGETLTEEHPAIKLFIKDCKDRFDEEHIYLGGLSGLTVIEIPEDEGYRITEYDGAEGIELESEIEWN